jgi:hypothetical protein
MDGEQQTWTRLGASNDDQNAQSDVLADECTVLGIAGKRVVPGEVLRQQHKEHDANRPHFLSHIGNRDLLQESHTNNDQYTNIVVKRKFWLLMLLPNRDNFQCFFAIKVGGRCPWSADTRRRQSHPSTSASVIAETPYKGHVDEVSRTPDFNSFQERQGVNVGPIVIICCPTIILAVFGIPATRLRGNREIRRASLKQSHA